MKSILLTTVVFSFLSGGAVLAGEGHAHGDKSKQKSPAHEHKKCDKCKKGEKNCMCDEKDSKDHDHNEDQKK